MCRDLPRSFDSPLAEDCGLQSASVQRGTRCLRLTLSSAISSAWRLHSQNIWTGCSRIRLRSDQSKPLPFPAPESGR